MNRGGGNFTPRGRGRGGPCASPSPSPSGSAVRRSHNNPVGAEPSSSDHMSGDRRERSWYRKDPFSSRSLMSWTRKAVQPVASAGRNFAVLNNRDRTDFRFGSLEFDNEEEILGNDITQSRESDLSSDCIRKGCVDWHSPPAESSAARQLSWRRDPQPGNAGWKQARLVAHGATSKNSDLCPDSTFGITKSALPKNGSADGPLALDRSFMKNLQSLHDMRPESENSDKLDLSQHSKCTGTFDICPPKAGVIKLKSSLFETNREKRNQIRQSQLPKASLLRRGMVLLKHYISIPGQVKIVEECRKLGLGSGGFYQPGYRDGSKLNLRMMCLGKNWDPETSSYGDLRPVDGAKPPQIPRTFLELVKRCIKESHSLIAEECGSRERAEAILPWMSPDICLVNFYTQNGRLGLHQDRDESEASLQKGLPVVSISIGDKAEFFYGDQRDEDKAERVTLESGDVLIFGGKSRHVFHGVSSILANTMPKSLLEDTRLRPGRLNLTFREY